MVLLRLRRRFVTILVLQLLLWDSSLFQVCKGTENERQKAENEKEPTRMHYFRISEEEQPFMARIDRLAHSLKEENYEDSAYFEVELTLRFLEEYKKALKKTELTSREYKVIQAMVQKYQILKRRQAMLDNREPAERRESCYDKLRLPVSLVSVNFTDFYITGLPSHQDRRKAFGDLFGRKVKYKFWDTVSEYDLEIPTADGPTGAIALRSNASFSQFLQDNAETFSVAREWRLENHDKSLRVVPGLMYESQVPFFRNRKYWTRDIAGIEIAAALTHWSLWKEIDATNSKYALVFDDGVSIDARGLCDVGHAIKYLENNLQVEWDMLFLDVEMFLGDDVKDAVLLKQLGLDWTKVGFVYGAYAYAVSARGVKKLIRGGLERCIIPIDEYFAYMFNADAHPRKRYIEESCGYVKPEGFLALRWRGTKPVYKHINPLDNFETVSTGKGKGKAHTNADDTFTAAQEATSEARHATNQEPRRADEEPVTRSEEGEHGSEREEASIEATSLAKDPNIDKEL